jgi:hypothetical protein
MCGRWKEMAVNKYIAALAAESVGGGKKGLEKFAPEFSTI